MDCLTGRDIEQRINECLTLLFRNDKHLVVKNVSERALSHMLACYLKPKFNEWDVDCEYNKDRDAIKSLSSLEDILREMGREELIMDIKERKVIPDIIVHQRGTDDNLIVIEMKKSGRSKKFDDFDIAKLKAFRKDKKYCFAMFIKVIKGKANEENLRGEIDWI